MDQNLYSIMRRVYMYAALILACEITSVKVLEISQRVKTNVADAQRCIDDKCGLTRLRTPHLKLEEEELIYNK